MQFSVMLWGTKKLVPAEYWCPYGTVTAPIFGKNQNSAPQSITEKHMELVYYLDE